MNKIHIALIAATVGLTACEQQEQQADTASHSEQDAAVLCPTADADGRIAIAPGLTARILSKGAGRAALLDDYADVHTTLWLYDESADGGRGLEVWSSGGVKPFQFQLGIGQVIKGWDMGVPCMRIGETRELIVTGDLGYGPAGRGEIPPNATLLFNIELVDLTPLEP